jgi:hypothetical protein
MIYDRLKKGGAKEKAQAKACGYDWRVLAVRKNFTT